MILKSEPEFLALIFLFLQDKVSLLVLLALLPMNMSYKIILLVLSSLIIGNCFRLNCQTKKKTLLFNKYTNGSVLLKNGLKISTQLNYDTSNKTMMYQQNGQEMILLNNNEVDTIYISNRKFIPYNKVYVEFVETKNNNIILINWNLKQKYRGNKGAYSQITQNKVETLNTSYWTHDEYQNQSTEIVDFVRKNEYWFRIGNEQRTCKNEKDLIKIFPEKKNEILQYIKENKVEFNNPSDAIKLIDFCLTSHKS